MIIKKLNKLFFSKTLLKRKNKFLKSKIINLMYESIHPIE